MTVKIRSHEEILAAQVTRDLIRRFITGVDPERGEYDAPLVYVGSGRHAQLKRGIYSLAADGLYDYRPFEESHGS